MINYICIKNNIVENILFFKENDLELLQKVKENFSYNELIVCDNNLIVNVGYLYDGTNFYKKEGIKAFRLDESDPDNLAVDPTLAEGS